MQDAEFIYTGESFRDARDLPHHSVPLLEATSENLREFGNLVPDFHREEVTRVTWPKPQGWRPLTPGSGASHAIAESDYVIRWEGDIMYGDNLAFTGLGTDFALGRSERGEDRGRVLVRDTNYHPDGGQVFYPKNGQPFVLLMAPPVGDDVTLESFRAFWFDGSCGFHIAPNVWHQAPLCQAPSTTFFNKQSSVFACVSMDSVIEFGHYMSVPLSL